jgi:hypothetical protein
MPPATTTTPPSSPPGLPVVERKSKPREAAKSMFLVAYSATSKSITHEMMMETGLCPMECHSLQYDGFKYSFVKLYRRAREGQIKAFMLHALNKHGVEQIDEEDLNGTKQITTGARKSSTFSEHPALIRIKANISDPSACDMESWKDDGVVKTRLGKRFNEESAAEDKTVQLTSELEDAKKRIKELEEKLERNTRTKSGKNSHIPRQLTRSRIESQ